MAAADVAAAMQSRQNKKDMPPPTLNPTPVPDEDVEDEAAILNEVSPKAAAAIAAARAAQDDDGDGGTVLSPAKPAVAKPVRVKSDILDRSQSFGFVSPPELSLDQPPRLAHFYQNGKYFDANGARVQMPGDAENDELKAAEMERTRKARAERLRREASLLDQGLEPETPDEEVVAADVNLTQWALFAREYRFAEVRKAIQVRYQRVLPTEDEARNFLVDEGVVTEDQVRSAARTALNHARYGGH